MSSEIEKAFFRLYKLSCNTSLKVTQAFTIANVLKDFENSLGKFLEAHKCAIYHLWRNTARCCSCTNFQSTNRNSLVTDQFKKLYNIGTTNTKGHYIKRNDKVIQYCLCSVSVNPQCSLNTLDISMMYTLLNNCANLNPDDKMWLTCVRDIRNKIAHTLSTTHNEQLRLDKWWKMLEGAVLGLASKVPMVYYEESIKENIDLLKNSDPTASQLSDIADLMRAENAKLQDQLLHQQNNICDNQTENMMNMLQQFKEEMVIEIRNLKVNVKLHDVPSQTDQLSSTEVSSAEHQAAHSSRMHTDQSSTEDSDKQYVEWRIANPPEAWRVEQMKTEIDNMSASLNQKGFNVEFVYIGSLVIYTSVPKHVLLDRTILKSEIKTFLEKVVEVCNIDTNKHEKIEIDFTVKNRISDDAVFPKDNTGIKTEVTQDFKDGDDGVQCPLCHNCCKECEENREKTKRVEKHNRKLKNDVEKFYLRFEKTNSMFDELSKAKDFKVLEPSSKRIKLDTDAERLKAEDREKKADGKEVDEDAECDVCKTTDSEENNEMVFCDGCNVCVHQACYGIRRIPRGKWYCKPCSEKVKPECVLCPNTGGAMKKTSEGTTWAHVVCALWIREVKIENTKDMEPILDMDKIPPRRWALTCCLCKKKVGACIQCDIKNCKKSFHVTCAFRNNLKMEEIEPTENTSYMLKPYCQIHSNQGSQKKKPQRKLKAVRPRKSIQRKSTEKTEAKQILDVQSSKKISTDVSTKVTTEKGGEAPQKGE